MKETKHNELKVRLHNKLTEIGQVLLESVDQNEDVGVLGGSAGIALFHFYYSRFLDDDRDDQYIDKGSEVITETFSKIQKGFSYPTFCDGIAGACWVFELLKEEKFIELQEDIITPELDHFLLEQMKTDIQEGNYDFLHGAMGYGYYFLKRYQNATSKASKLNYKKYLFVLLDFLKETAIHQNNGMWWTSEIIVGEEKFKGCNLGLSHGVPSILNFLCRLGAYPDFYTVVQRLLRGGAMHILDCKHSNTELTSTFSNWVTDGYQKEFTSRLAWCYGDLGIGITLLRVGHFLEDKKITQEAIHILKRTTLRKDVKEALVKDAGICHGAFGIMHIYEHVFRTTKDPVFREAANYWGEIGLDMDLYQDGLAGYKVHKGDHLKSEESLLEGIAGIGLAILSYLSDTEAKWDESLLIG